MVDEKNCVACHEVKTAGEFYKDKRMKSGLSSECKQCVRDRNKEYLKTYDRPPRNSIRKKPILTAEEKAERIREKRLARDYGLQAGEYRKRYEQQDGKCAICGNWFEKLYVDHCHSSDIVRGLLCMHCNFGLGHFLDSISNLENAIRYLKKVPQI